MLITLLLLGVFCFEVCMHFNDFVIFNAMLYTLLVNQFYLECVTTPQIVF